MKLIKAALYGLFLTAFSPLFAANATTVELQAVRQQIKDLAKTIEGSGFFSRGLAGEIADIKYQTGLIKDVNDRVRSIKHRLEDLDDVFKRAAKESADVVKQELRAVTEQFNALVNEIAHNQELLQILVHRATTAEVVKQLAQLNQVLLQAGSQNRDMQLKIEHLVNYFIQKIEHDVDLEVQEAKRKMELHFAEEEARIRQQEIDAERNLVKARADEVAAKAQAVSDLVKLQRRLNELDHQLNEKGWESVLSHLAIGSAVGVVSSILETLALQVFRPNRVGDFEDIVVVRLIPGIVTGILSTLLMQAASQGANEKKILWGAGIATSSSIAISTLAELCHLDEFSLRSLLRTSSAILVAAPYMYGMENEAVDAQHEHDALQKQKKRIQAYLEELAPAGDARLNKAQ